MRDSHYIVASLQPGDQPTKQIFVEQHVLVRLQDLARSARGRYMYGLLVGEHFDCPITRSKYALITSTIDVTSPIDDEAMLAAGIHGLLSHHQIELPAEVLGSYCTVRSRDAQLSEAQAQVHQAWFAQSGRTAVVVAEGAGSGAFYLHDTRAGRWFQTPFYEVTQQASRGDTIKATSIDWRDYMTAEAVVRLTHQHGPGTDAQTHHPPVQRREMSASRPSLWRSFFASTARDASVAHPEGVPRTPPDHGRPTKVDATVPIPRTEEASRAIPVVSHREAERPVADSDDTSASDTPDRYLELARSEGFFVMTAFTATDRAVDEKLWVLNEPYSGLLLTLVATNSEVLDASLHYNLEAEDAEVFNAAFPEHRAVGSRTIYVREWCVELLRARCRKLRASGMLRRQWLVAPTIHLLTPTEWEAGANDSDDANDTTIALEALNQSRLNSLPESVQRQFCLTPNRERIAMPTAEEDARER
jgi:hypothetical protein